MALRARHLRFPFRKTENSNAEDFKVFELFSFPARMKQDLRHGEMRSASCEMGAFSCVELTPV
ncbi:hypothetical protein SAMN05444581_10926 [Methylocapsa palsarum]|uniref:Uncharacterized protein n=1 Tax=Methylocapsa palsarum TaxID=1612308 RepID=A0A1I4A2F1_9HYPH|nr:hypothetical protein SAMN05444581_10926 [Methylocapsa palsarum]